MICEAAAGGKYEIAKYLCAELRCDVNRTTLLGSSTALHLAAASGYRQICSLLITYGADVDWQDHHGNTPMHIIKKKSILKLLMKAHANPLLKNKKHQSVVDSYVENTLAAMPTGGNEHFQMEDIRNPEMLRELENYISLKTAENMRVSITREKERTAAREKHRALRNSSNNAGSPGPDASTTDMTNTVVPR